MSDNTRLTIRLKYRDKQKLIEEAEKLGIKLSKYVRIKLEVDENETQ